MRRVLNKYFKTKMKNQFSIFILFLLISCKPVASKIILGVDITPEWKTINEIEKDFVKYNIPHENRFILDTAIYYKSIEKELDEKLEIIKSTSTEIDSSLINKIEKSTNDDLQPVQIRYFDSSGLPIFKLVNCYLENPFKMDWNFNNSFDQYPPKIENEILNFENKDLYFFLPMLKNMNGEKFKLKDLPKSKYYVIVFWNQFFKRPSRKLIKQIQEIEENRDSTFVFYVNNNNAEVYELIPKKHRQVYFRNIKN